MFPKTAKKSGTNVSFEQDSKLLFRAAWYNISKKGESDAIF